MANIVKPKPVRRDIPDEKGITYFQYGRAETNTELNLPTHLTSEQLSDWYAGWCSVNGKAYINEDIHGLSDADK